MNTKNCIICNKKFHKRVTCSKKEWIKTKCCSRTCANEFKKSIKSSCETKEKISKSTLKRYADGEIFGFQKGMIPWCKGTNGLMKPNKASFRKGQKTWNKGISPSKETIKKMVETRKKNDSYIAWNKGKRCPEISKGQMGDKNPFWKGGITPENMRIRKSAESRLWREEIFERDNYTCQKYKIKGGTLHPHHIKNFSQYPELRFAIDNGITFSEKAHKEFHKIYGQQNNTEEQLKQFLKVNAKQT